MKLVLLAVFPFPNRLRASFATLLPNAGASLLTVQALLGHKHVDTTMRYARLYDSTMAADYVQAMHIKGGGQVYGRPRGSRRRRCRRRGG